MFETGRWIAIASLCAIAALAIAPSVAAKEIKKNPRAIKDEFIVTLTPDLTETQTKSVVERIEKTYGVKAEIVWPLLPGFFVRTYESKAADLLSFADVVAVEPNIWSEFGWSGTQSTWSFGDYLWYKDRLDDVTYNPNDKQYDMCTTASDVCIRYRSRRVVGAL